jgi:hypothetical protein
LALTIGPPSCKSNQAGTGPNGCCPTWLQLYAGTPAGRARQTSGVSIDPAIACQLLNGQHVTERGENGRRLGAYGAMFAIFFQKS